MKKTRFLRAAATLALALSAPQAIAQPAAASLPDADPAMWVVKDEDTTIYMFGTFHMLDGKSAWFNDEVKAAYDASKEVVLEAVAPENPAELQPLIMKYAVDASGKKLSSRLSPETLARLNKELAAMGVPANAFDALEPWFVSMTLVVLGTQKLGLTGEHGPETLITAAARKDGKPLAELEGFEQQIKMFDTMPEDEQVKYLGQTLESFAELPQLFGPMKTAWEKGDVDGLVALMNKGMEETPDLYKMIFSDRNAKWADWIDARMDKPGTVFMAVGAGHLAGKDSVQDLLAAKGIKAEKVEG